MKENKNQDLYIQTRKEKLMRGLVFLGLVGFGACSFCCVDPGSVPGHDAAATDDDTGTGDDDTAATDDDTGTGDDDTAVGVLDGEFTPIEVNWTIHEIDIEVVIDQDTKILIEYGIDGFKWQTPSQDAFAGEPMWIRVKGLLADSSYQMRARSVGDNESVSGIWVVVTDPAPADDPVGNVLLDESELAQEDEVLCATLAPFKGDIYYCFNRQGQVVGTYGNPSGDFFRELRPLGNDLYAISSLPAERIVIADGLTDEIVHQWYDFQFDGKTRFVHAYLNDHDVIQLTEGPMAGGVAFMTWSRESTDQAGTGLIVIDPDSGEVLYDWHSLGQDLHDGLSVDPDMLDLNRVGLYQDGDWAHGNALLHMYQDGQDFFLMSLRTQDWIIKIDTTTDQVKWRLGREGDFTLVDDLDVTNPIVLVDDNWFYQQHAPEITLHNGSRSRILVYDNGYVRPEHANQGEYPTMYSRIVEYEIDETTMQAMVVNEYSNQDIGFFAAWYGDADRAPDGRTHFVDGLDTPFIGELDSEFSLSYRLSFQTADYHEIYRVDWRPSIYDADWRRTSQQ